MPKPKKGEAFDDRPRRTRCPLCRDADRSPGQLLCDGCERHQRKCRATIKRVYAGRRKERLTVTEERGRALTRNI